MADDSDASREALEHLEYLTRSEHHLRVLDVMSETLTKPGQDSPGYDPREFQPDCLAES